MFGMDINDLVAPLVTVLGLIVTVLTIKNSNAHLRSELKADIAELRSEVKADLREQSNRITALEDRVYHLALIVGGKRNESSARNTRALTKCPTAA